MSLGHSRPDRRINPSGLGIRLEPDKSRDRAPPLGPGWSAMGTAWGIYYYYYYYYPNDYDF